MPKFLQELALGAIPVAGAIGSAALQQHYALRNWRRANEYNHPRAQIERLKEAGLPLATMFGGSGGSQTSVPNTPNVDPSLGTAQGLGQYFMNRFQKKQMELLDEQINTQKATTKKTWADALYSHSVAREKYAQVDSDLTVPGMFTIPANEQTNLEQSLGRKRDVERANAMIMNNQKTVSDLTTAVHELMFSTGKSQEEAATRVAQLVAELDMTRLNIKGEGQYIQARQDIIDGIKTINQGTGSSWDALNKAIESILVSAALSNMR